MAAPSLSVVIPTYQRRAALARLLDALGRQTLPPAEYEVIVSIDGSVDGTWEMVSALSSPLTVRALRQPNAGRAAACNAGIRRAEGRLVVLLDDDMEPAPTCLSAHRAAHAGDGRRGVLGAVPIAVDADAPPVARYVAAKFGAHLARLARPDTVIGIRDFYTGNFSIRRDVLLDVGLFDEAFRIYGNEDVELAVRLLAAGVPLVYAADALAWQHYDKDFRGLARDTLAKGRTAVLCAAKHPDARARSKLATYEAMPARARRLVGLLLGLSRLSARTPDAVIALVRLVERLGSRRLDNVYRVALDYFYWLGARAAGWPPGSAPARPSPDAVPPRDARRAVRSGS